MDFEDVPLEQKGQNGEKETKQETNNEMAGREQGDNNSNDDDDDADDDKDVEFEDVGVPLPTQAVPFSFLSMAADDEDTNGQPSGDLELTLIKDTRVSLTALHMGDSKKGPSKIERLVRTATHCVHVQSLLWHNAVRNAWLCDTEVQGLVLSHLPPRLWDEVDRWRRLSGLEPVEDEGSKRMGKHKENGSEKRQVKGDQKGKGKGKEKATVQHARKGKGREWSGAAARLEPGAIDMSHGDPLFRLLRVLGAWWRQKFRVTAPGMRKTGYMTLERLDRFLKAAKDTAGSDTARFGERIRNRGVFREYSARLEGSRDVGAQLFTALLRALGLETRLVASLQPLGFGWSKLEDADLEEEDVVREGAQEEASDAAVSSSKLTTPQPKSKPKPKTKPKPKQRPKAKQEQTPSQLRNIKTRGKTTATAILVDDDDNDGPASDLELAEVNSDNESVMHMSDDNGRTPHRRSSGKHKPAETSPAFDKDLAFPIYWSEVLSPVTHKYVPVDALVKHVVATNRELIESFEPRGAKADKARQVQAYLVGYEADGTAKDVTVRYLRRQMLPGRTRGVRFPIEKVPIYDKHGKVKRYDRFDWFRQAAMRGYMRGCNARYPLTKLDEAEENTDLLPVQPEKKLVKEGEETLQYYKQSKEFVLERHLKREEALVASAVPIKVFRNGKKKGGKKNGNEGGDEEDESVYLRTDVVAVKSAETWHKQGRAPLEGAQPLKMVPYRAATLNRRREIAEAEAATGERVLQALYSFEQTDWIIPAPIRDGVIPKNTYGNIDLFAPHMCPQGAVHVPFRGALRVCRKLGVDCAEAVVDFEFGHRMAVPVIQGVVVAAEHHDRVMKALARDEAERARKEDQKRQAAALSMWRKMLMGLRVVKRIQEEYGDVAADDERDVLARHAHHGHRDRHREPGAAADADEDGQDGHDDQNMAGGFLPEGYVYDEDEDEAQDGRAKITSSFFPVHDEDEEGDDAGGGGFVVE